ncbi:hypothetical protein D9757_002846 [Collybiopsis confluens]|uniref:Mitochondrial presequence protease n=1 Tax=Collybiopsis confluens TaxID=2823264 RepID=A0A8H5HVN1_9AGAR|nr:hypothetical protein D9757_002846 [Collybiopsis confluens]
MLAISSTASLRQGLSKFSPSLSRLVASKYAGAPLINSSFRNFAFRASPAFCSTTTTTTTNLSLPFAMSAPQLFGNFDLLQKVKLDYTDVVVSKYRSRVTGLNVIHLDYEAPIINGYFVVGTEIFDDSGCPHTLEHLVFMGSEKFPYKGILDHLANRGFSNGTNAWTDQDHTAYTVSTAGSQGFLQLLPIYVDHILYPTITKAGFVTEVHHIDEKGHDSGVVYSEMQGRENTSGDLMALRTQRLLYPPSSAYRSETGGLMESLRKLTVEQIRDYHGAYYVPHNLSLIVAGKLPTELLLSVVQNQVEPSLVAHGQHHGPKPKGWKRPFVETPSANIPPISQSVTETIDFPEQDESVGELVITFLGPAPNEFLESKASSILRPSAYIQIYALDVLGTYLTSSSTAPLNKEYVEIESPLCTYIYFTEETRAGSVSLPVYVGSVPTAELTTFDKKLKASLQKIVTEGIDMERMTMVINREERQLRSKIESSKGETFVGSIISDVLYGTEDGSEISANLAEFEYYSAVKAWTSKQWTDLLQKYYIDPPSVVVIGRPSAELAEKLEKDEKKRLEAQAKALGPEGLKAAKKELEEAKAEHDRPIPTEVLTQFQIPNVSSISWIPVSSYTEKGKGRSNAAVPATPSELARIIKTDGEELPFFVEYDHVDSDFVSIHAVLSLSDLPSHLVKHISIYLVSFFTLPVRRYSGARLSHEEVVNKLEDETVSYEIGLGLGGSFAENLRISFKVEIANYENAVAWLHDLLYGSEFDKERMAVAIAKVQQALPESKRDGNTVLGSLWADMFLSDKSRSRAGAVLQQVDFIPQLAKELQENTSKVISDFEEIRKHVTNPSGMRFGVTGNVMKLQHPRDTWAKYFKKEVSPQMSLNPVALSSDFLSRVGAKPSKKAIVMSLATIESSFVTHSTQGIKGFDHPLRPAFSVALEVLNATESYLWRYIRGSGLAYGAYTSLDLESGLLSFTLYRSSNALGAFKEARSVLAGLTDGSITLDDTTLDAAKSTIVYDIAKQVSTAGRAAIVSFANQALKNVSQNYQVDLLEKYQAVTKGDVLAILRSHFLPLFDAKSSVAVVVTAPSKAGDIETGLREYGFDVERRSLEVDPNELDDSGSESESGSESDSSR